MKKWLACFVVIFVTGLSFVVYFVCLEKPQSMSDTSKEGKTLSDLEPSAKTERDGDWKLKNAEHLTVSKEAKWDLTPESAWVPFTKITWIGHGNLKCAEFSGVVTTRYAGLMEGVTTRYIYVVVKSEGGPRPVGGYTYYAIFTDDPSDAQMAKVKSLVVGKTYTFPSALDVE